MDSDEGKLFIGGIAWDTDEDKLIEYFRKYGDVTQAVVMRERTTGRHRGFAFIVFSDPTVPDRVLQEKHVINGRTVDTKKALSREEQQTSKLGYSNHSKGSEGDRSFKTKKIFVGGLPSSLTDEGFQQYFESYGHVTDVVIMYDQNTKRPRGFGFISFESEDAVDRVLHKVFHELNGKIVEVKRALPKDASQGVGGGGHIGGYQSYGALVANAGAFNNRMDGSRYMQLQNAAGAFPLYSGSGGPGYGYGAASSNMGYGGYGSFGIGAYGSVNAVFSGLTGAYSNFNVPRMGYLSAPPVSLKSLWGNQTSPSYVPSGYSPAACYGGAVPWGGVGSIVPASAPIGRSPIGVSGYGNQGYGYGNYDGANSPYSSYGKYGTSNLRGGSVGPNGNTGYHIPSAGQGGAVNDYTGSSFTNNNGKLGFSGAQLRHS